MAGHYWRVTEERNRQGHAVLATWEPSGDPVKFEARLISESTVSIVRFEGGEDNFVQGAWRIELSGPVATLVQFDGEDVPDIPDSLWRAVWRKLGLRERFDF